MNQVNEIEEVEILIGDKGYLDLAYPLNISEEKRNELIGLLKKIYHPRVVKEIPVKEFSRDWRIGERKLYPREWTAEEYSVLLECETIDNAVEYLGRSWQACELKDADWRYRFLGYCDKHSVDLTQEDKLTIIKKFMGEQEEFKKMKKSLRKEKNKLLKELEKIESSDYIEKLELYIKLKQIPENSLKENKNRIKMIKSKIKEIDAELEKPFEEFI
jgi:hypothetical protein